MKTICNVNIIGFLDGQKATPCISVTTIVLKSKKQLMTRINKSLLKPTYDDINTKKRLGLILLSSDLTTEPDYARLIPTEHINIYSTRLKSENPITLHNLRGMRSRLTTAASLLPEDYPPTAICYSCTAASVIIGDDIITESIQSVWPNVPVVTPSYSAVTAFKTLGVKRISILTPYLLETSEPIAKYFMQHGLEIQRFEYMNIADDRLMARVQSECIFDAACAIDCPETEAIFISCTALPALQIINSLEQKLGKPVVTSNQATAWVMLHHAKITNMPQGYGRVFNKIFSG